MRAVHRVPRLERHDPRPPQLGELRPQLAGRVPQEAVVVVRHRLQAGERAAHVPRLCPLQQLRHTGMVRVRRAEHGGGLRLAVRPPHVLHVQRGQHDAFRVAQRQMRSRLEPRRQILGNVKRDGHRPERPVREAHLRADAVVVAADHEAGERREPAVEQQLQVAQLARCEVMRRPVAGYGLQLGGPVRVDDRVDERPAMRRNQMVGQSRRLLLAMGAAMGTAQDSMKPAGDAARRGS